MSNQQKKKLMPKVRFPEFKDTEGWEVNEVGEVFQVTRGNVLAMGLVQEHWSEETPYPVYSSQTKNNGLAGYYNEFLFENAITWTTDGANAGDVNYRSGKFYCTNVCGVLINEQGNANPSISALINSVSKNYVSYVGNPKLMNGVMSKIKIPFPSIKEQQKIADCLSSLDALVNAENKKLEALQQHKKGLLQQLFPAKGEKVPKRRFKEFRNGGEWVEKTLGQVCRMQAGKFISASDINETMAEGLYPCYGGNGLRGYTHSFNYSGTYSLIGRQGALCGNITLAKGDFYATEHAVVVTPEKGVNTNWLFYLLGYLNLNQYATGQAQPGLSVDNLEKVNVKMPKSETEQQKIANCFSSLDDLITEQSQKIESLKTHKKSLTQRLFPNMN
jgi:type I restriction enzyme, S subunit